MQDPASQFIALVFPWSVADVYCNIHWRSKGRDGKLYWGGRATQTIQEFASQLLWLRRRPDMRDLYVCMSAQAHCDVRTAKTGSTYKQAVRASANAVALQSLFIDIDVKPGAYATRAEMGAAIKQFLRDTGLPPPSAMVNSGSGGMHVHWVLEEPLSRAEWQDLADGLAAATQQHGLLTDPQCTVDAARILRIPGTLNYKGDPEPFPVTLQHLGDRVPVAVIRAALAGYKRSAPVLPKHVAVSTLPRLTPITDNDELGAGVDTTRPPPPSLTDLMAPCAFLQRTVATGGRDNPNPLWFLTSSIATFTEGGRADAHLMANGHPDYAVETTDAQYDRALATRAAKDYGWPQCSKISSSGAPECASCPLLRLGKSPFNFVTAPAPQVVQPVAPRGTSTAVETPLPDRYIRDANGIVQRQVVDDDGNITNVPVSHYPMTEAWLSNNPWTLHFTTRTDLGQTTRMEIPTELITSKDGLTKYLGGKGIFVGDDQAKVLKGFLLSWIQKLQQTKDAVISSAPFGWSDVDGQIEGFAYAGRVWSGASDRPAANTNPVLSYKYSPKGTIDAWSELAKIITDQGRPHLDAILAGSFAAPLVRFTGHSGVMLNAYSSESGIGKTTTMSLAQAVWASPKSMQQLNDTSNSVMGAIGQTRSLPLLWDELKTDEDTKRFVNMVFTVTSGREKTRMNSDSTLKVSGEWQTLLISASNDSLLDPMQRLTRSTTAGIYRLFEYAVTKVNTQVDSGVVQRLIGRLATNHGQAGLIYAKFLGAEHKRIEMEVAQLQDELIHSLNSPNEERFWIATIATVIKGAQYANELGLTTIDVTTLREFLVSTLEKMRTIATDSPVDVTSDMGTSTVLSQFIGAMRARHMLITNRVWTSKGRPSKNAIQVVGDTSNLDSIAIHLGRDDGIMRISSTQFSRWMADHDYSRHIFTKKLKDEHGAKMVNGKLGGGTDIVGAMEYLIELDLNDPKLKGFIE